MDFTLPRYKFLLQSFISKGYFFVTFKYFIQSKIPLNNNSLIILRHDVDRCPQNSLRTAEIEHLLGIKGSYYFRIVPESFNVDIIRKIASLGHEIGYHYEDMDLAHRQLDLMHGRRIRIKKLKIKEKDLIEKAYELFCKNLKQIRMIADINTICMHGSPLSKFDNRTIWEKYNFRDLGIIGEPYFDIDWNKFAYFSDTGRRWNGENLSIRDKVKSEFIFNFKSTKDIIHNIDRLPPRLMLTIHPERWTNNIWRWHKQLVLQNSKNIVKGLMIKLQ